jgi:aprataxin
MTVRAAELARHLHLHVISNDLVSDRLTTKKHYNSFKPNESYFLKLTAVETMLDWTQKDIDREISVCAKFHLAHLRQHCQQLILQRLLSGAKGVLALPLSCHKCGGTKSTMPAMKEHLEDEWRREGKASRRVAGKKAT